MENLDSPDLPAFWCYGIVALAGLVVAYGNVTKSLEGMDDRWRFWSTWLLFAAYALVPLLLYWLLAWTGVVRDTSVVAAVVVGLGYRQVATTGVAGIKLGGQWPVWQPFVSWANRIADRIVARHAKERAAAFERLERLMSKHDNVRAQLQALATELAVENGAGPALKQALQQLEADFEASLPSASALSPPGPLGEESLARLRARRLLKEVRTHAGDFEQALMDRAIFSKRELDDLFGRKSSWAKAGWVLAGAAVAVMLLWVWAPWGNPSLRREFYIWRMGIANATPADQDRTHAYFVGAVGEGRGDVILRLVGKLEDRTTTTVYADRALPLTVEARAERADLDSLVIPALIDALRAPQADVRARVQNTLVGIRELDYPNRPLADATRTWSPTAQDAATEIEVHRRAWLAWWRAAPPTDAER